ncbi:MAG: YraN family protein [Candidatus Kerfeldbacteria bacterium]|nr:YraN family protein [Candidatus Kerfeldbacteria bacterium]
MPTRAMSLGWRGEAAARAWLEQRGFVFLAQHFRTRAGEIDLVMQDDRHLVFVEVKTRRSRRFGVPEESVTERKLERLQAAAEVWLQRHPWSGPVRFDLVVEENGAIRHLRGIG